MAQQENLREILFGGQTFSWFEEAGKYKAVLNGTVYTISSLEDAESDPFLRSYFDLDYDYEKARCEIRAKDETLRSAVDLIGPIRILKQDEWTAAISFILSQNNNIKRITGLYRKLSVNYGKEVQPGYHAFPTPEELSSATEEELRALGVGFRAPFILDAVKNFTVFEDVKKLPFDEAMERLQTIKGIGPKVASCILIFGYGRKEGFPVDVWIKKALSEYYPDKDISYFAPYQALSQQYLFSWIRAIS